jgi:hypothetical protein
MRFRPNKGRLLMKDWLIFRQILNPLKNSVGSVVTCTFYVRFSVVKIFLLITWVSFQKEMRAALWSYS